MSTFSRPSARDSRMIHNYFAFDDQTMGFNSGTAHMILVGGSYLW